MEIYSLQNQVFKSSDLFDLFRPTIKDGNDLDLNYRTYEVTREDEMRIDLIMQKMYDLLPTEIGLYLENIDVILTINNIDNPLNIKQGMILKYPDLGSFDSFRIQNDEESIKTKKSITQKLGKPNKQTRIDPARKKYLDDVALPPTVNKKPKNPISTDNVNLLVGGL
jgi:hypothetical protein